MSISPFSMTGLSTGMINPAAAFNPLATANPAMPATIRFSNYSTFGVPGLTGGYAYPPGSEMAKFMDGINNTVAAASSMGSLLGGAMGNAGAAGVGGTPDMSQLMQMLMSMMSSLKAQ